VHSGSEFDDAAEYISKLTQRRRRR
jgi:hypothetical protein